MSTRKILLVDDSKSARYALRLLLQKQECEVDTAESAESALEKVKENMPYAIFMDHLMPGMNGFEALDVLKADPSTAHIPVVMCTSNDDEPYQLQAQEKGALGILPKPATPERLSAVLELIDTAVADVHRAAPAPEEPPEAVAPAEAPAAATAPATGTEDLPALVRAELTGMLEEAVQPLVERMLAERLEALEARIVATALQRCEARTAELTEDRLSRLRGELAAPAGANEDLLAHMEGEVKKLRGELVRMESDHAQAVVQKLSQDVLPDMVGRKVDEVESQVFDRLDLRLGDLGDRLVESLPDSPSLIRRISDLAETAAEHKAAEVASSHAKAAAESSAEEKAGELSEFLMSNAESGQRRMYLLAAGAAAVGVLSSLAVYFLGH